MKNILLIISLAIFSMLLSSCEITVVEEPVVIVVDERNAFTGVYNVDEYNISHDAYAEYSFDIVKSSRYPRSIFIRNFYGVGIEVIADVDGNYIYIPEQVVDGYRVKGDGILEGRELILNYSVFDHFSAHSHTEYFETSAWR